MVSKKFPTILMSLKSLSSVTIIFTSNTSLSFGSSDDTFDEGKTRLINRIWSSVRRIIIRRNVVRKGTILLAFLCWHKSGISFWERQNAVCFSGLTYSFNALDEETTRVHNDDHENDQINIYQNEQRMCCMCKAMVLISIWSLSKN